MAFLFFCLAQVVAERLFSPPDSSALPQDKPKRSSRTLGPEEAIPKNVVTPSHPQLLNMAAQLLEQAEGSRIPGDRTGGLNIMGIFITAAILRRGITLHFAVHFLVQSYSSHLGSFSMKLGCGSVF